jgi:uncharacterized protein YcbK (DUF882 family)
MRVSSRSVWSCAVTALVSLVALDGARASCVDPPETRDRLAFDQWVSIPKNASAVAAYEKALVNAGVADLIPMDHLLRSSSRWAVCHEPPYSVPPQAYQRRSVQTLRLLKELKARGLLPTGEVASMFRGPKLNHCSCGADNSQHLYGAAIDFYPDASFGTDKVDALCDFWRTEGRRWKMGISRYSSGRIHIDTGYRHRTWPADALICKR